MTTDQSNSFMLPARDAKPRSRGITSMIDFGPDGFGWAGGEYGIRNLLEVASEYIDYAKIYAMNALLIPGDVITRTTRLYRDAGIIPFAGGILFEYAYQKNQVDALIAHLRRLGIPGLEVSENYITLADDERHREIERLQKHGFRVVYEYGRKRPDSPLDVADLGGIVGAIAEHGIDHVTVEQSEMDMLAATAPDALTTLATQPWFEHLVIEADPYRFPGQHVKLLKDFGPDVNLANIAPGQILRLEGFRRGVGRAVNYSILGT